MPKYVKYLKEIMSNKRKLEDLARITLSEECLAILQNKLPPKLKDPGSFTILCTIGSLSIDRALADLGAGINLMSYSMFRKLGLGEPKPIRMSIQLAEKSTRYPRGIIEDVLLKVDKFIFPVDFVILDMEENFEVPLILGRPFLATGRALIDVEQGKLILRVQEEEVIFETSYKSPFADDFSCYKINKIDEPDTKTLQNLCSRESLEHGIASAKEIAYGSGSINDQMACLMPITCHSRGVGGATIYIQGIGPFTYTHQFTSKEEPKLPV